MPGCSDTVSDVAGSKLSRGKDQLASWIVVHSVCFTCLCQFSPIFQRLIKCTDGQLNVFLLIHVVLHPFSKWLCVCMLVAGRSKRRVKDVHCLGIYSRLSKLLTNSHKSLKREKQTKKQTNKQQQQEQRNVNPNLILKTTFFLICLISSLKHLTSTEQVSKLLSLDSVQNNRLLTANTI